MKKSELGILIAILGGLILSIELYSLKFIYLLERMSGFPWKESPLSYLGEPNVVCAVLISILIIFIGIILAVRDKMHL